VPQSARAALDAELKSPYQVRVVLQVAEHRMLTWEFHKLLESQLRDQLRLAFGKLAEVEVTRFHPLLGDIRAKGLQAVLDGWDELSNTQTHFVLIDYANGQYEVQTGQHDGMTGLSGAVVRREHLADRQRVADVAAQMVRKNFGVVGTFDKLDGKSVRLAIKGGQLLASLSPWVQRGDIFAVVRLRDDAGSTRARPVEWAILQVTESPKEGYVRCNYFCRYAEDRFLNDAGPGTGYRCVQLRTTQGPLRVRLVNEKTQEFLSSLRVIVSANDDFKGKVEQGTTFKGLFEAQGPFHNVAYVKIQTGEVTLVQFPVPIMDDRTVVCRMSPDTVAMKQGELERRKAQWIRWHVEARALADQQRIEFNSAMKSPDEALKVGRGHLSAMEVEMARLASEQEDLENLAKKTKIKMDLGVGIHLASELAERQKEFAKYLDDLDRRLKEANSEETKELIAKITRAQLMEKQADFDKAIEQYEVVLKVKDSADVKARLDQLRTAWAIKSKEHGEARRFLYDVWPSLDLTALHANIGKAKDCFSTCKEVGDRLTPRKLVQVNFQHASVLVKELEVLRRAPDKADNHAKLQAMTELASRLRALENEVEAWLEAKDKAATNGWLNAAEAAVAADWAELADPG
jgi:hypothetical protein